jgi:hypothetical protein
MDTHGAISRYMLPTTHHLSQLGSPSSTIAEWYQRERVAVLIQVDQTIEQGPKECKRQSVLLQG